MEQEIIDGERERSSIKNFQKAVTILKKSEILFWVDQGTLLGCIRDHRLIPWDHDIDFGVWKDQVNRELLITNFMNMGFQHENIPQEMDCIHLLSNSGKKIDITFYEKEGFMATAKWLAPRKGFLRRVLKKITDCLEQPTLNKSIYQEQRLKSLFINTMIKIIHILPQWLRKSLLKQIKQLSLKYPHVKMIKCSIPIEIFCNFKDIRFLDVDVKIPVDAEMYLSLVYGSDWIIPKRNFIWWRDSGGLESL